MTSVLHRLPATVFCYSSKNLIQTLTNVNGICLDNVERMQYTKVEWEGKAKSSGCSYIIMGINKLF